MAGPPNRDGTTRAQAGHGAQAPAAVHRRGHPRHGRLCADRQVAAEVGGAAWAPFLVAFIVATITAFSYLELVTRYPQAAGAALYTHKAFGIHFLTFLVAFTVMCSGITSASTASNAFAGFLRDAFELDWEPGSTRRSC